MEYFGKWKISDVLTFTDSGMAWKSIEEADEDALDPKSRMTRWVFADGGLINIVFPLADPEMEEAAKAEGMEITPDGAVVETYDWKIENGVAYFDTKTKGEVLGEEISPWAEIKEEDGKLVLPFFKLERDE